MCIQVSQVNFTRPERADVYKQKEAIPTPAIANDEIASNLLFV